MARSTSTVEHPSTLADRALAHATNDQALEIAHKVLGNLASRAENAADIAIDSDDRDAENEALVFAAEVRQLLPSSLGSASESLGDAWHKAYDAENDVKKAIQNRRASSDGRITRVEQFSWRRQARIASAWEVQRRREEQATTMLVQRANVTTERVLAAARTVEGAAFRAKDVAVALLPEIADTSVPGRMSVINRVAAVMRRLVASGQLDQQRPDDSRGGRDTYRYSVADSDA